MIILIIFFISIFKQHVDRRLDRGFASDEQRNFPDATVQKPNHSIKDDDANFEDW